MRTEIYFIENPNRVKKVLLTLLLLIIAITLPYLISIIIEPKPNPEFSSLALSTLFLILSLVFSTQINFDYENTIRKRLIIGTIYILAIIPLGEFLGWYYSLWAYMPDETDWKIVLIHALNEGIGFAYVQFFIALLYLFFIQKTDNGIFYCLNLFIFKVIFGWAFDIFVNKFDTYLETFFVWFIMEIGFMLIICYNMEYFYKGRIKIESDPHLSIKADSIIIGILIIFSVFIFTIYLMIIESLTIFEYFTTSFIGIVISIIALSTESKFAHSLIINLAPIMVLYYFFNLPSITFFNFLYHLVPVTVFILLLFQRKYGSLKYLIIGGLLITTHTVFIRLFFLPEYLNFLPENMQNSTSIFILLISASLLPAFIKFCILFYKKNLH